MIWSKKRPSREGTCHGHVLQLGLWALAETRTKCCGMRVGRDRNSIDTRPMEKECPEQHYKGQTWQHEVVRYAREAAGRDARPEDHGEGVSQTEQPEVDHPFHLQTPQKIDDTPTAPIDKKVIGKLASMIVVLNVAYSGKTISQGI